MKVCGYVLAGRRVPAGAAPVLARLGQGGAGPAGLAGAGGGRRGQRRFWSTNLKRLVKLVD